MNDADQAKALAGALERGEAWKCRNCEAINGNHNDRCWNCNEEKDAKKPE